MKRSGAALAASYIMPTAHFLSTVLKSDNSKSLAAALFYGTCSISMNFLNKAVVSSYNFNYPFFIMVCQMVTTIVFLDTLRYVSGVPTSFKWISFRENLKTAKLSRIFSPFLIFGDFRQKFVKLKGDLHCLART